MARSHRQRSTRTGMSSPERAVQAKGKVVARRNGYPSVTPESWVLGTCDWPVCKRLIKKEKSGAEGQNRTADTMIFSSSPA
jgi:hypothetical protein